MPIPRSTFFHRTASSAARTGRLLRIHAAMGSRFGTDKMYVGERWSIVTCAASRASAGTSVTAVAPLPITMTRLPAQAMSGVHFCG